MPLVPGVPGHNLPPGDEAIIRRIQEIDRVQRETFANMAQNFAAAFAGLEGQVAFLGM